MSHTRGLGKTINLPEAIGDNYDLGITKHNNWVSLINPIGLEELTIGVSDFDRHETYTFVVHRSLRVFCDGVAHRFYRILCRAANAAYGCKNPVEVLYDRDTKQIKDMLWRKPPHLVNLGVAILEVDVNGVKLFKTADNRRFPGCDFGPCIWNRNGTIQFDQRGVYSDRPPLALKQVHLITHLKEYKAPTKKEVLAFVKPYTTLNDELTDPNHLFRDVVECLEKAELNDGVL